MLTVRINKRLSDFTLDVSFQLSEEITVLFGPSGSGKTTILNCIAGITNPDKGLIDLNSKKYFNGKDIALPIQKRNIGYLFQDYALFPHMTVRNNILYGVKNKDFNINTPLIKQLLMVMNLEQLLDKYPNQISGGEKQRVALARALAIEPDLLLLDEPFSALDNNTRLECHNELLRLHQLWKIPILLVTHDYEEAKKLGDKILFIDAGNIKLGKDYLPT